MPSPAKPAPTIAMWWWGAVASMTDAFSRMTRIVQLAVERSGISSPQRANAGPASARRERYSICANASRNTTNGEDWHSMKTHPKLEQLALILPEERDFNLGLHNSTWGRSPLQHWTRHSRPERHFSRELQVHQNGDHES